MKPFFTFLLLSFLSTQSFGQSWRVLSDSLQEYLNNGEYNKALPVSEQVLIAAKKEFGEMHSNYATSLNNQAQLYTALGEYKKAEPLYIEANNILKKVLGENDSLYASSIDNMGQFYEYLGQLGKAESLFIQAKEIRKKVLGETHPDYATSLNNLGHIYFSTSQYEKAELLYIQSKDILKIVKGETDIEYAIILNNLAALYQDMGQYEKAELLFFQSAAVIKMNVGETHPYYAGSLNNLGLLYEITGQYSKAEPLYLQANKIKKELAGENNPDYAITLNNLGLLYKSTGQYDKAESFFIQAKEIRKNVLGESHQDYGQSLNNLAYLYAEMGLFEKAEQLHLNAKEILRNSLGENNSAYATCINNLGILYDEMKKYDKAEAYYLLARDIRKKVVGENHLDYAASLNNLAFFYYATSQFEKAEPLYLQASEIFKKVMGSKHPAFATSLFNLSALYSSTDQFEKAETLLGQEREIKINNLLSVFNGLSENEKGNYLSKNFILNNSNNSLVYNYRNASSSFFKGNYQLQLFLKSLSLTSTKNVMEGLRNEKDSAIQAKYFNWKKSKAVLAKEYSLPLVSRSINLKELEEQTESLEKELTRHSTPLRNQQTALQVKMQDVQKNLQQDEVAIEFVSFRLYSKKWTDSTIYAAYVLTKNDSFPHFVPLFEEKKLQQLLDDSRKIGRTAAKIFYGDGLVSPKSKSTRQGEALSQLIWQPLDPYLKGVKKIYYSPSGKLFSIAFHALPLSHDSLLMEKYDLQQYTSTRQVALRNTENQTVKPLNITLFGNADFSMDSIQLTKQRSGISDSYVSRSIYSPSLGGDDFEPWRGLPGTAEEVNSIKELFNKNKIATRSFAQITASEENLKLLSGNSPQILHIATHGFFLPDLNKAKKDKALKQGNVYTLAGDPLLRTGLILAGGNYAWSGKTPVEGVEDGIVTAYEISQLNLSNTELVVLSACETALGDVKGSDGVFGLQRAFKMAGVKKMIVSLWQVPDKETAELMSAFYTYWIKGKSINEAFAAAQADMRKKYAPFYWAAFVLVE